jgi:hypothetical protein
MPTTQQLICAASVAGLFACARHGPRATVDRHGERTGSALAQPGMREPAAKAREPTLLIALPVSAFNAGLALDDQLVFILTPSVGYRLAPGQPPQRLDFDFGSGPVLTDAGIAFWSKGAIWYVAKDGGSSWRAASLATRPEYFVASEAGLAWLERDDDGLFRIKFLGGQDVRVLLADQSEISALHMVHDSVFFVRRAGDGSWRIGRVSVAGGEPRYAAPRSGPTPAQLTGSESIIYYDMESSELRQLTPDLEGEYVWLQNFVCSPIYEAIDVYCARVEGLFVVSAQTRTARPLTWARRETITLIRAAPRRVVWIADAGPDRLVVETLSDN